MVWQEQDALREWKKRHNITVCDIDELEKSEQKTGNVTQINARHKISKCTLYTYAERREFPKCQQNATKLLLGKTWKLKGIEFSEGNENKASVEHSLQHRNPILDSSIDRRWFSVFALKEGRNKIYITQRIELKIRISFRFNFHFGIVPVVMFISMIVQNV